MASGQDHKLQIPLFPAKFKYSHECETSETNDAGSLVAFQFKLRCEQSSIRTPCSPCSTLKRKTRFSLNSLLHRAMKRRSVLSGLVAKLTNVSLMNLYMLSVIGGIAGQTVPTVKKHLTKGFISRLVVHHISAASSSTSSTGLFAPDATINKLAISNSHRFKELCGC